ncbi:MAG: hypothetical protein ABI847_09715 [Anaerolineales bacterium]
MAIPTISPMLTEADWQTSKSKSLVAKLAGETGMGALLRQVKTDYDAVNWTAFDAQRVLLPSITVENSRYALTLAEAEYQRAAPLLKDLRDLETLATATARKFAKNILMPKATYEHVFRIGVTAKQLHAAVEQAMADFETAQKKVELAKAPRRRGVWTTPTQKPLPTPPLKTGPKPLPQPKARSKPLPTPPIRTGPRPLPKTSSQPLPQPKPKGKPLPPTPPQLQLMTVKEAVGEKWFTDLAQLTLPENLVVLKWSIDREVANPFKPGSPLPVFVEQQTILKTALSDIDSGVDQLMALKDKRVALAQDKAEKAIEQMRGAFEQIRPVPAGAGFAGRRFLDEALNMTRTQKTSELLLPTGLQNKVKTQKDQEPDTPETAAWKQAHTSLIRLNQQTADAIEQQFGVFQKLAAGLKRLSAK